MFLKTYVTNTLSGKCFFVILWFDSGFPPVFQLRHGNHHPHPQQIFFENIMATGKRAISPFDTIFSTLFKDNSIYRVFSVLYLRYFNPFPHMDAF